MKTKSEMEEELNEYFEEELASDLQELIDDDNRERARDINLALQGR